MSELYHVGLTSDGMYEDGTTIFGDIGLERLTAEGISWSVVPVAGGELDVSALSRCDALLSFGSAELTQDVVEQAPRLRHVARFGVGYDSIDTAGLTGAGVAVTITRRAVRRPVALSALTLILALAHRLVEKHQATAAGEWASARVAHTGIGVTGRTVGIIGLGGIGSEVARLANAVGLRVVALCFDDPSPYDEASEVARVGLEELLESSDFVVLTAPLNPETLHMVDEDFLRRMRSDSYIVNVGRGGLIDQPMLTRALQEGWIGGAGLDVLEQEPPDPSDPLLRLHNVILTPHSLAWTREFADGVANSVIEALIEASRGDVPPDALNAPSLHGGWRGSRARRSPTEESGKKT